MKDINEKYKRLLKAEVPPVKICNTNKAGKCGMCGIKVKKLYPQMEELEKFGFEKDFNMYSERKCSCDPAWLIKDIIACLVAKEYGGEVEKI